MHTSEALTGEEGPVWHLLSLLSVDEVRGGLQLNYSDQFGQLLKECFCLTPTAIRSARSYAARVIIRLFQLSKSTVNVLVLILTVDHISDFVIQKGSWILMWILPFDKRQLRSRQPTPPKVSGESLVCKSPWISLWISPLYKSFFNCICHLNKYEG